MISSDAQETPVPTRNPLARPLLVAVSALTLAAGASVAGASFADDTAPAQPRAPKAFPANARFDYQIGAAYKPGAGVKVVSRDVSETPAAGLYNLCYVNGFQTQPDDGEGTEGTSAWFAADPARRGLLLTNPTPEVPTADDGGAYSRDFYVDPGWPDEIMFDIRTPENREALAEIVGRQVTICAGQGFDAVEVDNLDTFTRAYANAEDREAARTDPDFDGTDAAKLMSPDDALAFARLLIDRAHEAGLAIAQKNTMELGDAGREAGFDLAVVEECGSTGECADYAGVYGSNWVDVEYSASGFTRACRTVKDKISVVRRDDQVTAPGSGSYVYAEC